MLLKVCWSEHLCCAEYCILDTVLWKFVISLSYHNGWHPSVTYFLWGQFSDIMVLLVVQSVLFWFKPQNKLKDCMNIMIVSYLKAIRSTSQNTVSIEDIWLGKVQYGFLTTVFISWYKVTVSVHNCEILLVESIFNIYLKPTNLFCHGGFIIA